MTRYWLGVVSREHVRRGVEAGFAQANHGKRAAVARMRPGDKLVYYSPRERMRDGEPVQSFTAIGTIDEGDAWEADEGCFKPWRRPVTYRRDAQELPIAKLRDVLDLTAQPNWGIVLRRGLLELSPHDYAVIAEAMGVTGG
ncbi:EVE domain-containing protein [Skermania sp. ID1734]|uniref:EVE domain-containing protein n=1 Tax=Skermania sp. ID1734 TaxID=2597516 RepID=UPI00117EED92|nr:EVE domain-containing protein [Skermania sp. ID1734]TSD97289.1 EVE domain-containing protein [Skermania sp. ID1734]